MKESVKDIKKEDENKIIDNDKNQMENKILNDFNFSFDKKEINDNKFFSNIIFEKESENNNNDNSYDYDEDKKEENSIFRSILDDLNKNIEINIKENENKNSKVCQEILGILKMPLSDKNIRYGISPFKPLLKPKKISLIGKVFYDIPDNENNSTKGNSIYNSNNNGNIKSEHI